MYIDLQLGSQLKGIRITEDGRINLDPQFLINPHMSFIASVWLFFYTALTNSNDNNIFTVTFLTVPLSVYKVVKLFVFIFDVLAHHMIGIRGLFEKRKSDKIKIQRFVMVWTNMMMMYVIDF